MYLGRTWERNWESVEAGADIRSAAIAGAFNVLNAPESDVDGIVDPGAFAADPTGNFVQTCFVFDAGELEADAPEKGADPKAKFREVTQCGMGSQCDYGDGSKQNDRGTKVGKCCGELGVQRLQKGQ